MKNLDYFYLAEFWCDPVTSMLLNYFYSNEGINFKIWQIIKIHSGC